MSDEDVAILEACKEKMTELETEAVILKEKVQKAFSIEGKDNTKDIFSEEGRITDNLKEKLTEVRKESERTANSYTE
jgi:exoribonuclease II